MNEARPAQAKDPAPTVAVVTTVGDEDLPLPSRGWLQAWENGLERRLGLRRAELYPRGSFVGGIAADVAGEARRGAARRGGREGGAGRADAKPRATISLQLSQRLQFAQPKPA